MHPDTFFSVRVHVLGLSVNVIDCRTNSLSWVSLLQNCGRIHHSGGDGKGVCALRGGEATNVPARSAPRNGSDTFHSLSHIEL